ncbi:VC0807 family protein [Amycolatopsis sp. NPDC058986]|uniref:VC0807 family protein n=1 Tax=unclassified Amycolatopsis TaxID=2618356 RepID=UPI00366B9D81
MTVEASSPATPVERTHREKTAALRKHLVLQLLLELVLPLGGYYGLRAAGLNQWLSLVGGALLALPMIGYTLVKQRRVDPLALFTLSLVLLGALTSMVTGDPRLLLVRDSWIFGALGLWVLGSLLTRQPFMRSMARTIVTVKIGAEGHRQWDSRWDTEPAFRRHLRVVTLVWGLGFCLDAVVRVILAYSLPIDSVPLVSTLQWLVVLGGLIAFHIRYVTKHGLKV